MGIQFHHRVPGECRCAVRIRYPDLAQCPQRGHVMQFVSLVLALAHRGVQSIFGDGQPDLGDIAILVPCKLSY